MRCIVEMEFPVEPFNALVRDGNAGEVLNAVIDEIKPEAVYFYSKNGCRGGILIVNLECPSQIPAIAEPLFLNFGAKCTFNPAMTPEDLAKANLDDVGKRWS